MPTNEELEFENSKLKEEIELLKSAESKENSVFCRYQKMINNIGDVIAVIDRDGTNKYYSPNIEKMFGWTYQEVIGKPLIENIHTDDTLVIKQFMTDLMKNQDNSARIEVRYICKDGSYKWIELIANNLLHDEDIEGLLINFTDITEHKQAEEILHELSQFNLQVINNAEEGIIVYDCNMRYKVWNKFMEELTGKPATEVIGKHPSDLFPFLNEIGIISISEKALKGITTKNVEFEFNIPSLGKSGWASDTTAPLYNFKGEIIGGISIIRNITERKKAEIYVEESKNYLDKIINTIASPVFVKDQNNRVCIANDAFCSLISTSRESLIGTTGFEHFEEEQTRVYIANDQEVLNTGKENINEESYTDKQGITNTFITRKTTFTSTSGQKYLVAVLNDITEIKKTEEKIHEKDIRFRKLLAIVPDFIFQLSRKPDGNFCFPVASDGIKNIFGCTPEDVIDDFTPVKNVIFPEDYDRIINEIEYSAKHLKHFTSEFRVQKPGKDIQWIYARSTPERMADGSIAWFGFIVDITERKQVELALNNAKEIAEENIFFLKESQKAANIGSYKADFLIDSWKSSETLDTIFGIDENFKRDVNGWYEIIHPDEKIIMNNYFNNEVIAKQKNFDHEYRIVRINDKEVRWVHGIGDTKFDTSGKFIEMIGTIQDITEKKYAEKLIIESQRLSAMGEMASSVAHDFNNSLQIIMGNIERAVGSTQIDKSATAFLESAKDAIINTSKRIQLLQRFGGKQIETEFSTYNINDLISEVIEHSKPLWKDNIEKQGFRIDIKTKFCMKAAVSANKGELNSAIYNIFKNSIEAMPKGGEIFIETKCKGENILISFSDTGIGMSEESKDKIFQPFYTTKGFDLGRGLGMIGVRSIVNEHGGNVYVKYTEIGKGTTIEILLPRSENEATDIKETYNKPSIVLEKSEESTAQLNILWVEDDEMQRNVLRSLIEISGQKGDVVGSGKLALEIMENKKYDIVFTDVGMAGMTGLELAEKIKINYNGQIKVVIVSGWGNDIDTETQNKCGISEVISKPFSIKKVEDIFKAYLQK
ncbi:MAG: PAS domain S-box protein [Bacteroidetes bacterium]|nr:PAS domain S-box protein [Bacteroidota bacterium]